MSDVFSCHIEGSDPVELVLAGELDAFTAPLLLEVAATATGPVERLDCRSVTFMSAAGITALLQVCGFSPVVVDASPVVRRVIELTGVEQLLRIRRSCRSPRSS